MLRLAMVTAGRTLPPLALVALLCVAACHSAGTPAPPSSAPGETAGVAEAPTAAPRPAPPAQTDPPKAAVSPPSDPIPTPAPNAPVVAWRADEVPPLSPQDRETFWGSVEDESPAVRGGIVKELEDVHYTIGNEWSLFAFYEDIKDTGGGYVGVGPDQAYLFIGWQRPQLAWLIDYDAAVLRTHQMYKALFAASDTPRAFLEMFEPGNLEQGNAAIDEMYDGAQARGLKGLLRRQRRYFRYRLRTVKKHLRGVDVPTYLTDQETFDYVKAMLKTERVRPLLVNLNESPGIEGLSAASEALNVPVRVLYVSNAEEYWKAYDPQFVRNVSRLPTDDSAVLLRTRLTWKTNRDYTYIVQPISNYRIWLADPGITRVRDILSGRPISKPDIVNTWRVDHLPPGQNAPAKVDHAASAS